MNSVMHSPLTPKGCVYTTLAREFPKTILLGNTSY